MEPKVLADALVEAGILTDHGVPDIQKGVSVRKVYSFDNRLHHKSAELWLTDWRVAGKCLESLSFNDFNLDVMTDCNGPDKASVHLRVPGKHIGTGGLLPRAIIEAWYGATEQEGE